MGASNGKEAFRTAILDLVNNQQVSEEKRDIRGQCPRVLCARAICMQWTVMYACVVYM